MQILLKRVRFDLQQAIAILDSGVGGLTVVKEVMRQLPQEKIIYFGDTARTPYGPRPADEVLTFTRQIVDYLLQYDPKMIVIACNTATAVGLQDIRSRVNIPVLGVIHPGVRAAIKMTKSNRIGVIGTEGTIRSGAYVEALRQISPHVMVEQLACPQFVTLVENGQTHGAETERIVTQTLQPMKRNDMDCLILGCTHYPFLSDVIGNVMGDAVQLISSADETAREVSTILYHRGQLSQTEELPVHQFFSTGEAQPFKEIASRWLQQEIQVTPVSWHTVRP
jgi:glutamate racemase